MYLLEIDGVKNCAHVTLTDHFDTDQAEALLNEMQQRIEELKPEFRVLCDVSRLEAFDSAAKTYFRSIMDLCNENRVGKVIRIFPDPMNNFGLNIMSMFHYCDRVKIITCESLNEARKHL